MRVCVCVRVCVRACVRAAGLASPRVRGLAAGPLGRWAASESEKRALLSIPDPPHRPGGKGTGAPDYFSGGATPIADGGGYGAGCPAIMINGGMAQAFM